MLVLNHGWVWPISRVDVLGQKTRQMFHFRSAFTSSPVQLNSMICCPSDQKIYFPSRKNSTGDQATGVRKAVLRGSSVTRDDRQGTVEENVGNLLKILSLKIFLKSSFLKIFLKSMSRLRIKQLWPYSSNNGSISNGGAIDLLRNWNACLAIYQQLLSRGEAKRDFLWQATRGGGGGFGGGGFERSLTPQGKKPQEMAWIRIQRGAYN